MRLWTVLCIGILPASVFAAADLVLNTTDARIVQLYSDNDCPTLLKEVTVVQADTLRPNLMAIVASCIASAGNQTSDLTRSETLFLKATAQDPYNDLVAILHAISLFRTNPVAARPYWEKTLMYARSESLREMAREALSGLGAPAKPLNLSPWTWTADATVGASSHSNPWISDMPDNRPGANAALDAELFLRAQRWFRAGSGSAVYQLETHQFPSAKSVSTQHHALGLPFALRVGVSEDLIFQPFYEFDLAGNRAFGNRAGIGFSGVAYRALNKQTVSGYAAGEHTYFPNVRSANQSHYHFSYQWEWFPERWRLLTRFSFDNISAERVTRLQNVSGDFNQSHNDFSIDVTARRGYGRWSIGLRSAIETRFDAHDSTYTHPVTGRSGVERRLDYTFELEPHVLWRVLPKLQLLAYLNQMWVVSTVTAADYGIDRNLNDTTVGIKLRTYWSSY